MKSLLSSAKTKSVIVMILGAIITFFGYSIYQDIDNTIIKLDHDRFDQIRLE